MSTRSLTFTDCSDLLQPSLHCSLSNCLFLEEDIAPVNLVYKVTRFDSINPELQVKLNILVCQAYSYFSTIGVYAEAELIFLLSIWCKL